jgi:hypothetical protein
MRTSERVAAKTRQSLSSRRDFVKIASAGAALAAAAPAAGQTTSPKRTRPLRIGALAVGEASFWTYTWGDLLAPHAKPVNRGTLETDLLSMEITHVWDVNPKAAETFAAQVGAKVVKRYDDMVGAVDGVAFGGYYEVPWQHRLARPYIEAGMPTCLSRPFAYSLRDIDTLLDLAARHNTPIMATDIYEHLYGVKMLKSRLANVGEIECVHGTCLTDDYPLRFHVQFMILKIFGFDIGSVSLITDDPNASTYVVGTYLFKGWKDQPPFPCSLAMTSKGALYSFTVSGTKGIETERLPQFAEWSDDLLTHHLPMLVDMQRTLEGKSYEPLDLVRKKTELFLTGFYSASERNGAPVTVGSVPVDWRARPLKPDWIADSVFSR